MLMPQVPEGSERENGFGYRAWLSIRIVGGILLTRAPEQSDQRCVGNTSVIVPIKAASKNR